MLEKYILWTMNQRKLLVAFCFLMVFSLTAGVLNLSFTSDFRAYFGPENPQLKAFEAMEETFSKQENLYFFIHAKEGTVFTPKGLELIWVLSEKGWELPFSQRVTSLQNYQHTDVEEDDLVIDYLYYEPENLTATDIKRIEQISMSESTLRHKLISDDGSATGVSVRTVLEKGKTREQSKVAVAAARELLEGIRPQYPEFDIYLGGSLTSNVTMGEAIKQDVENLLGVSYLVMIIIMIVLLRTFSGMLVTLLIISFSIASTMGLFGWLGYTMTPPSGFVPTAVMTIAVADTIHILVTYYYELAHGRDKIGAIRESMRINFSPIFITSITTMVGVLCLNTSDSPPYRDMGNMIAAGVLFAWLYSVTFLPAFLAIMPTPKGKENNDKPTLMKLFADAVIKHAKKLFIAMGVVIIAVGSQVNNNQISERWHEFFDESFEVRNAIEASNEYLGGLHRIFFVMDSGEADGINNPEYLQQMDDFAEWMRQQPKVTSVDSLTDIIKRLNKNMNANDESAYVIPQSRELAAQLLFMYELSLPQGLGLDDTITNDRSATRLTVSFSKADSGFILEFEQKALKWLEQNAPDILVREGTGLDIVFANLTFRNINSMLTGTTIALFVISLLLIFALRSFKIGLISLIPNIIPAILAYGIWSMVNGRIDTAVSVVICLSLGIVVDDTVHFLSKYLRARRERNLNAEQAIQYAFRTVGNALIVTSLVLVGGFMVMQFSHFNPSTAMGLLLAITILVALVVDFLFLPPLLMLLDKDKVAEKKADKNSARQPAEQLEKEIEAELVNENS
jgi:predicted RND superfamily exporter protein